ncbi:MULTISPECIES: nucleoside transporter [Erwinia]|uniref:Nucleoside transporter n=1 Tax=Erwinia pyrifoliae TaxID=79967 RepID=A0ABY5X6Q8_ERWPY|nr:MULTISPECIES: nucleoside transporter [Erwinia]ADP10276.1 putative negative regulator [Erwinia sp. Ejp617]AUX73894.1 nucleoside transporter [Erwinia pyrifoliae]MCA8875772.1 nucleoside transporter [Erwinia pyrifoliae]MCT2387567.1 nucleoside transporter [Erwinia pyrifoliae]MCU8585823.1 nucleoside transporter [Erwinia pyrifoliae]
MQLTRFTDYGLRALFCPASLRTGRMTNNSKFCHITPACRRKTARHDRVQRFLHELDRYTLAERVEDNHPLYPILLIEYPSLSR